MPVQYNGTTYPILTQDKLTLGEVAAVERVTGLTLTKIRRLGEKCVCGHGVPDHLRIGEDGEKTLQDTSCKVCDDCGRHEADMPTQVTSAFIWVSVKRGDHEVKFSDIEAAEDLFDVPVSDEPAEESADEVDPTQPDPPEESPS